MTIKRMSSREFNRDTGRAKSAAADGPVYITDRGRPSHVLLTFQDYLRLAANEPGIVELLAQPEGGGDLEIEIPAARETPRPARFD